MQPGNKESEATPALVLSDECLLSKDLSKSLFGSGRQLKKENNLDEEHTDKKENHSGDPFSIYKLLKKKKDNVEEENNSKHSMKYPLGFTPKEGTDVVGMHAEESRSDNIVNLSDHNAEEVNNTFSGNCLKKNSKEDVSNSVCSGHFKTSMVPRTGGSILSLMDELVKVGQVMGYKMDGCMSNMTKIIESQGVKEMLWDYLTYEIGKWKGEVVIMGDFNEVQYKSDRFGSMFNVQGANVFNSFITNAGLEEVPLGGSSFTWCHKSATKMSKLDRFLISKNLLNTCPNITAITLERYHSDHRPILLRESHFDYGPTPFRFFHHWIKMEGFSKVVEDAWREGPCDESNAMINIMIKLKYLKTKIREWNKKNMLSAKNVKAKYKDVEALETIIDKGDGNVEVVNKRMEVVNTLQKIDICSSEMAQKAKVKWTIEGDENTSFFHGMLNKKRSLHNIWGIKVDGMWIESPNRMKGEFFHHFSSRFDKPGARRAYVETRYPKTLTCDQQVELESDVSNEEIKRADAVKYFFTYGVIPKGCNSSFIALIPIIPDANTVKDFRPISLIGSQWCDGNITTLVHVLECFYRASGLRINMSKSKIMGVSYSQNSVLVSRFESGRIYVSGSYLERGGRSGEESALSMEDENVVNWSQFFNGKELNNKKASWVNWKKVLAPKEKGGICVSSLYALNRGLMFKWMWRFYTQNTSLWVRVIKAIHGDDGKVGGYVKCGAKSCWLSIMNEIKSLKNKGINLLDFMYVKLGNGDKTTFWEDIWIEDRWIWALESSGDFSVASVRKVIDNKSLPEVDSKTRWIKYVPIKVNVHAWKVKTDSLLTRFNVSRRGVHIDSIMRAICDKGGRDV
nr:RNA-directed DNA polymerase, eukaryota [Tanacetum cinerariifolium]